MNLFDVFSMAGGLALFLFGMQMLGDGLSRISGGRLEKILERLTSSPIKGVLLGVGVTAVIQSSSASTVMVVGFVNSGIMKLNQAVSIIMGANIGTTVTSWILSLTGIESDNFWVQLLKPTSFSPVLAFVGVLLFLFSKKEIRKNTGTILLGFAVLMYGMDAMSAAVKPLSDVPEFTNILFLFQNPFMGMLAGAFLTAIVQSSSASVGILQALSATGAVRFSLIVPVIMGQNIGTCITAMLSSIGASKNAKRTALVHLYFNIIGTIIFMLVFYTLNAFVSFPFMERPANAFDIAFIHSLFNIAATIVLLPFSRGLVKLANMTVKNEEKEETDTQRDLMLRLLDERFLDTPSLALDHCRKASLKMAKMAKEVLFMAMEQFGEYSREREKEIFDMEKEVDGYEDALGTYLVKLGLKNLSEKDSHMISVLLHTIGDFERISDHAVNVSQSAKEVYEKKMSFSKKAGEELEILMNAVKEIVDTATAAFDDYDLKLAFLVEPLEEVIDDINIEMKSRHIKRLRKGRCTIEMGFVLSDVTTNLERVADHCSNIAVCLLQVNEESFDTHEYLGTLKKSRDSDYEAHRMLYGNKYALP